MAMSPEFPELRFVPPRAFGTGRDGRTVKLSVVHYTAGAERSTSAEDGAAYDQRRTDGVSCHLFHDSNSTVQCVLRRNRANSAFHKGNRLGVQHELCGTAQTRAQWLDAASNATLWQAAKYVADDCRTYGLQPRRLTVAETRATWYSNGPGGIVGHADITRAFPEDGGTHLDPGDGFPWDVFLGRVHHFLNGDDDMAGFGQPLGQGTGDYAAQTPETALAFTWERVDQILAAVTAGAGSTVALSDAQLIQLRDDLIAHVDTTLAAKIGDALESALAGPAGQAAIAAAVNTAEDS